MWADMAEQYQLANKQRKGGDENGKDGETSTDDSNRVKNVGE